MVQSKKLNDMSNTNGTTKFRDQQSNMSFPRKDMPDGRGGGGNTNKIEGRAQNGNASSFRTDAAISGNRNQGERPLQRWVPDTPEEFDSSLESSRGSTGDAGWDQFADNERLFGLKTDYDENIYTTVIDKSHPAYSQRLVAAEKKAREIERSAPTNSHVAEERRRDNDRHGADDNGLDEEDKYSGVRRQQDFPPLTSSSNKYTPPARRAPTGQSTVRGAPVDPAIISSQLAVPDKSSDEKSKPASKLSKPEVATPPTTAESSSLATPETKPTPPTTSGSATRTASPQVRTEGVPNATATVERDVASAFKGFAAQQRRNVDQIRLTKARNDKEIKLNDLKKFADSFKLNTPVPSDLVSIIAKDPAKQKEIQEKAKRNAEEAKINPGEAVKPIAPGSDSKPTPRPAATPHGASPSGAPNRQAPARNPGFSHQGQYNSQAYRSERQSQAQATPSQQSHTLGSLTSRLRIISQNKHPQLPANPTPVQSETRLPPTGPSNSVDPNFSRRSSGVSSAQGGRLNPNSSEFRPGTFAATFTPNGNPSTGSSPRSTANTVEHQPTPPVSRSLLKRKPIREGERPSIKGKFNALAYVKTLKPTMEKKDWKLNGGMKPAYDTAPTWRQESENEPPESTMNKTYKEMFEMAPFPTQTMSPPNPSHAVPQVPHQHQLPFHLQQGGPHLSHNRQQSPRQPPMNLHSNQHGHGPNPSFNGPDDHRMMSSHSAQSFASPRLQNVPMAFPSPMNQPAQLYNGQMMPYPAPPMPPFRSVSQAPFMPQQTHMGHMIMQQNPGNGFMAPQGMPPAPQMMYPPGGQGHFIQAGNGHPPAMPGVNGYPSPGRTASMMMSQGSQQGHQQPMYGMSPSPQYGTPIYAQQQPGQMPMRPYAPHNQFGTSPQQMHQYGAQHRNHSNGNYNNNNMNNKNFQPHGQHHNASPNNQIPTGPQRPSEGGDDAK